MVRPKRPERQKMHQLHVLVTPEEDETLAAEATRRGVTKSDVIRNWINDLRAKGGSGKR